MGLLSVCSFGASNILVILASGEDRSSSLLFSLVTLACTAVAIATGWDTYNAT